MVAFHYHRQCSIVSSCANGSGTGTCVELAVPRQAPHDIWMARVAAKHNVAGG